MQEPWCAWEAWEGLSDALAQQGEGGSVQELAAGGGAPARGGVQEAADSEHKGGAQGYGGAEGRLLEAAPVARANRLQEVPVPLVRSKSPVRQALLKVQQL